MPSNKTTAAPAAFQPTLLDFWGDVVDVNDVTKTSQFGSREFVVFDMANLEIIKAGSPYTLPTYQMEIPYSNRPNTVWAAFANSVKHCGYEGDINGLIGKRIHAEFSTAKMRLPVNDEDGNQVDGQWAIQEGWAMQITEIQGVENTSNKLEDALIEMADGKTATEFKSAFLGDMNLTGLTGYNDVAGMVMQDTFLPMMVTQGKLSDDGGTYHKKES